MSVGVARVDSSPDCCVPVFGAAVASGPRVDSTMGLSVGAAAVGGTAVGGTAVGGTAVGGTAVGGTAVGGTAVGGTGLVGLRWVGLRWAHPSALAGPSAKECCPRCSRLPRRRAF